MCMKLALVRMFDITSTCLLVLEIESTREIDREREDQSIELLIEDLT